MAKLLSYKVKWSLNTHSGQIDVKLWAGNLGNPHSTTTATLTTQSAEEMHMLVDLLRNESPIEYDNISKELRLGEFEVTGQGESQ